jgi:hypothetical protein
MTLTYTSPLPDYERAIIEKAVREVPGAGGPLEVTEDGSGNLVFRRNDCTARGVLKNAHRMEASEEFLYVRELVAGMIDPSRCL